MEMNYCMHCGAKLHPKFLEHEGDVPFCDVCGEYRFPVFNTAVSMILEDASHSKVILIRQYGRPFYILCAGYVSKGESAEEAAVRELREELGLTCREIHFNESRYFAPSNTLMLNFAVTVAEDEAQPNWEIDAWRWFTRAEARQSIKPNSLAASFLNDYLDRPEA